ncbi:MAG: alternative ribosome rescue aminoacyl-tRNA hydrolase ArfB [Planctomycetota bacterium]|nr:alternative ribosome rescue aminoacyl-tRNA hydrolase ArfB [Planctomycetota bacterium]
MSSMDDIEVDPSLQIPGDELHVEFSRSTGPGGQHVNKVETRVTLCFNIEVSTVLSQEQKDRLRERLASRINKAGVLRVSCEEARSQVANRELVRERFADLVRGALVTPKKRVPTKATRASRRKRVDNKRHRGDVKRGRGGGWNED